LVVPSAATSSAQAGFLEAHERLVAESRRVAKLRAADLDSEPRKNAERQIAFYREIPAGCIFDACSDFFAVIIGIKEQVHRHGCENGDADDAGHDNQERF
jgi:hypothetical protein